MNPLPTAYLRQLNEAHAARRTPTGVSTPLAVQTLAPEPRALAGVPRGVMVSIERETFPSLIERGEPAELVAIYFQFSAPRRQT